MEHAQGGAVGFGIVVAGNPHLRNVAAGLQVFVEDHSPWQVERVAPTGVGFDRPIRRAVDAEFQTPGIRPGGDEEAAARALETEFKFSARLGADERSSSASGPPSR